MLSVMMKIGELSRKTGVSIDAIRFYEKQSLIQSQGRTDGGYREFSFETAELLHFISKCRALDIPLPDVKKLLQVRSQSVKSCREANLIINDQLIKLRERIRELKILESQLAELRSICSEELAPSECKIIKALNR